MARTPARHHGRAKVSRIVRDQHLISSPTTVSSYPGETHAEAKEKDIFLPTHGKSAHNPNITVEPAYPGVFIYRFSESFNYINQAYHIDHLISHIYTHTRRTDTSTIVPLKNRLWSDAPPPTSQDENTTASKPLLRAVVLDFSNVNVIDVTTVQGLIDMRDTLARYAAPGVVEWHFAGVQNRWTRKALATAGFGRPSRNGSGFAAWCPTYTVAKSSSDGRESTKIATCVVDEEVSSKSSATLHPDVGDGEVHLKNGGGTDEEEGKVGVAMKCRVEAVFGVDRPFFHADLEDAVDVAVRDARRADGVGAGR